MTLRIDRLIGNEYVRFSLLKDERVIATHSNISLKALERCVMQQGTVLIPLPEETSSDRDWDLHLQRESLLESFANLIDALLGDPPANPEQEVVQAPRVYIVPTYQGRELDATGYVYSTDWESSYWVFSGAMQVDGIRIKTL